MLRCLPAEMAHAVGMAFLRRGVADFFLGPGEQRLITGLKVNIPGIGELDHPIGLAAGFDKNALAPTALARLGFAFLEVGTITPLPQPGNPKPRLFRLPEQRALVNRMGFNNDGASKVLERLNQLDWNHERVPLGVNVGKNKLTQPEHAAEDYLRCFELLRDQGQYFVFNVSSPNTPGLRSLANVDFLQYLAERLAGDVGRVWIKLDPDTEKQQYQKIVDTIAERKFQGIIVGNTRRVEKPEMGGISGHPLAVNAATCLEWAYEVHRGGLQMIASGGIMSGLDVYDRMARGASAVKIYTALVYRGPFVVASMLAELLGEMQQRGVSEIKDVVGTFYDGD